MTENWTPGGHKKTKSKAMSFSTPTQAILEYDHSLPWHSPAEPAAIPPQNT